MTTRIGQLVFCGAEEIGLPKSFKLARKVIRVGRDDTCDFVVDDPVQPKTVSRVHFTLVFQEGSWILHDGESTNGTCVNEVRVKKHRLAPGDVITMGKAGKVDVGKRANSSELHRIAYRFHSAAKASSESTPPPSTGKRKSREDVSSETKRSRSSMRSSSQVLRPVNSNEHCTSSGFLSKKDTNALPSEPASSRNQAAVSTGTKEVLPSSDMEADVTCSICQGLFVAASSLGCSHTFCANCIETWLRQHGDCPECREKCYALPIAARAIDSVVHKVASTISQVEVKEWEKANAIYKTKRETARNEASKLETAIAKAKAKGSSFLKIGREWSSSETSTFHRGVRQYVGDARKVYCESVGLNEEFIECAPMDKLFLATNNLEISMSSSSTSQDLRRSIRRFMWWGLKR